MNVIIGNKQQSILEGLNLDIIKSLNGEFEVEEIIETFKNFFYQRMILDITALKNYRDITTLQKLSISLDMEKLILLLDNTSEEDSATNNFLSSLISMGIYNFTKNAEGIMYLYNSPNSYRHVAQYHQINAAVNQPAVHSDFGGGCRVIGVKNLTQNSGATTLTYLMMRNLSKNYSVIGVEVDGTDFKYFNDKRMFSVTSNEISQFINSHSDNEVIIVDVGNSTQALGVVREMIYLVEPSMLKLNKLMHLNKNAFKDAAGKILVLNQSVLSNKEVVELEYEAKVKFSYNLPSFNERDAHLPILDNFLYQVGFVRQEVQSKETKKKWGIF